MSPQRRYYYNHKKQFKVYAHRYYERHKKQINNKKKIKAKKMRKIYNAVMSKKVK